MGGERGDVLVLALCRHNVVAPTATVDTDVLPQRGVAYHHPGVVLRGLIWVIFLPGLLLPK